MRKISFSARRTCSTRSVYFQYVIKIIIDEMDISDALQLRTNLETHQAVTQMGRHLIVQHQEVIQRIETIGALVGSTSTVRSSFA